MAKKIMVTGRKREKEGERERERERGDGMRKHYSVIIYLHFNKMTNMNLKILKLYFQKKYIA